MTRSTIGTVLALLLLAPDTHAGGRRRVLAVSPPSPAPQLTFLGNAGVVDAGTLVWRGGSGRSAVSTRTVSMRIGEPSREPRGTAVLRAFLEAGDARCTIRVDGVPLTAAPRVIRRHAPIGIPFTHRIEIDVPRNAPDGPLQTSIGWEVTIE